MQANKQVPAAAEAADLRLADDDAAADGVGVGGGAADDARQLGAIGDGGVDETVVDGAQMNCNSLVVAVGGSLDKKQLLLLNRMSDM